MLAQVSGRSRVTIDLLDRESNQIEVVHVLGEPRLPAGTQLPAGLIPPQLLPQLEAGRPIVADIEALPLTEADASFFRNLAVRYALAVPLVVSGNVIGLVGIDEPGERREFDESTLRVAEGIAPEAALAIDNARRFLEQARGRELAEALDEINRLIHAALGSTEAVQQALEVAGRKLGAAAGVVFLDERGVASARYHYGLPDGFLGSRHAGEVFPFATLMAQRQEPVAIGEQQLPELMSADVARQFAVRSLLAIPLLTRERVTGGIGLIFREPHVFTSSELDFARKLGATISLALENAGLYEAERDRARFNQSMVEINNELASSPDIDETIPRVFERACRELRADAAGVTDRVEGGWRIRVLVGVQLGPYKPGFVFPDERAPTLMRILRTGEPDITPDVRLSPNAHVGVAERAGYRAYVGYPLVVRGQVVGALGVFFHEPRHLTESEADYVRRFAFAVSLAEENSLLYEAERERARFGRSMVEINNDLASSLDIDETLPSVLKKVAEELGADGSTIGRPRRGRLARPARGGTRRIASGASRVLHRRADPDAREVAPHARAVRRSRRAHHSRRQRRAR